MDKKWLELLAHLDGRTFAFFLDRFTTNDNLTEEAQAFIVVKKSFLGEFQKKDEPEEINQRVTEASISM